MTLLALTWALSGGSAIHSCHEQASGDHCRAGVAGEALTQTVEHGEDESSCPACTMQRQLFSSLVPAGALISHLLSDRSLIVTLHLTARQLTETRAASRGPPTI